MFKNKKNVFWQALILTGVIFIFGLVLGMAFESSRLSKINEYYAIAEISLMDILALNSMIGLDDANCSILFNSNIEFADKIYEEALLLEKYEESGKMSDSIKLAHRKYDLLRTFLWINTIKLKEKCQQNFSVIVYLYEYDPEELTKKATQIVWSRILFQLKQEKGNEIILIPIAINSDIESLDSLIEKYEFSDFPKIIIDNEYIISELSSIEEIKKHLN
ncbi:MAG TPA: hypothetical protein VMZ91_16675 [Candidatus Paceibacterota bacterium]|nr:hypothetical protein [Candidatus Paceibacterota bacterium]